jgi:hypothetical protein
LQSKPKSAPSDGGGKECYSIALLPWYVSSNIDNKLGRLIKINGLQLKIYSILNEKIPASKGVQRITVVELTGQKSNEFEEDLSSAIKRLDGV